MSTHKTLRALITVVGEKINSKEFKRHRQQCYRNRLPCHVHEMYLNESDVSNCMNTRRIICIEIRVNSEHTKTADGHSWMSMFECISVLSVSVKYFHICNERQVLRIEASSNVSMNACAWILDSLLTARTNMYSMKWSIKKLLQEYMGTCRAWLLFHRFRVRNQQKKGEAERRKRERTPVAVPLYATYDTITYCMNTSIRRSPCFQCRSRANWRTQQKEKCLTLDNSNPTSAHDSRKSRREPRMTHFAWLNPSQLFVLISNLIFAQWKYTPWMAAPAWI